MGGTIPTELVYLASVMRMDDRQDIERAIAMKDPGGDSDASVDSILQPCGQCYRNTQGSNVPGTDSTNKVPSQRQQNGSRQARRGGHLRRFIETQGKQW